MLMPEPMTDTSDDRQPGRSEYVERKEVTVQKFPDADASPPRGIGGSGAGSTAVTLDLSEFAQHVVTSEWLAEVKAKFTRLQMDLAQSRATEAELRARGPAPCFDDLCHGGGQTVCGLDMDFEEEIEEEIFGRDDDEYDDDDQPDAERPARAQDGPQQPSEETR
jgi:hypothetical protein